MDFKDTFKSLTGNLAVPWQEALYHRFISDRPNTISSSCSLPTAFRGQDSGKSLLTCQTWWMKTNDTSLSTVMHTGKSPS